MKRKFTWLLWNYDFDGDAYVIAKSECPYREKLPQWLITTEHLNAECAADIAAAVQEGWCKYQVRSDFEDLEGEPHGGYVVTTDEAETKRIDGKRKPGWFPVWIVRTGEWY